MPQRHYDSLEPELLAIFQEQFSDSTPKSRQYEKQKVNLSCMQNLSFNDVTAIDTIHWQEAYKLLNAVNLPSEATDAIANVIRSAVSITIAEFDASAHEGYEEHVPEGHGKINTRPSLSTVLTSLAFKTYMLAISDVPELKLPLQSKLAAQRFAKDWIEMRAHLLLTNSNAVMPPNLDIASVIGRYAGHIFRMVGVPIPEDETDYQIIMNLAHSVVVRGLQMSETDAVENYEAAASALDEATADLEEANDKIAELEEKTIALETENNRLEEQLKLAHNDIDDAHRTIESQKSEFARKQAELDDAIRQAVAIPKTQTQTDNLKDIILDAELIAPASTTAIPKLAEQVWPGQIIFSNKALDDIDEWRGRTEEMWDMIKAICEVYLPSCLEGRALDAIPFQSITGYELALHEAETTSQNKKFQRQRTATVDGQTVFTERHLKGHALTGENVIRIYFAYQPEQRRIAIVRCGGHLDTHGTRRRGF